MNTLSQKLIRLLWLLRNILTKSIVRSTWSDSIIGDAGLTPSKQQAIAVKPAVKKVPAGATNLHGPWQQVLPLSNKSNDYMNNIHSDISVGTKPKSTFIME
jgi:hypothetical protein